MKFASYSDGSRDGQLVVVSRDLTQAHYATHIANRLQQVLDDWPYLSTPLQDLYDALNAGRARHAFAFDPTRCMAPLPRVYSHVQAYAYPSHCTLLERSLGQEAVSAGPSWVQCAGDNLWGPQAVPALASEALGADFEVQIGVIAADIPAAASVERALDAVRLLVLSQGMVLRTLAEGCAPANVLARPGAAFAPVAVTPDELGEAWTRGRVQLGVSTQWNGRKVGMADLGVDMPWHFGSLLSQLASMRPVRAGTLLTAGPVSNAGVEKKGRMEWPKGYHSIAEKRAMEILLDGQARTDYLRFGDVVRSEVKGRDGASVFGAVELELANAQRKAQPPESMDASSRVSDLAAQDTP
ncbi:MAG: fumarylacetoacetate hydrolase [Rhodoferax sp.]|nr:MAG: fumarylacetoacetate hydrolase [Rhodoferax sp.]